MKKTYKIFLPVLILAIFAACKRDKAEWDVDITAPIAKSSLTIEDMIPGSYVVANTDSSLRLVYSNTIYTLPVDSFLSLPDTTFPYAPPPIGLAYTLAPNTTVPLTTNPLVFAIDPTKLTRVVIREGIMNFKAVSSLNGKVFFTFAIPKAFKNNAPFTITNLIEAAPQNDSSYFEQAYDLSGYDISLAGNGNQSNILAYSITPTTDPNGGTIQVAANQKIFRLAMSFAGLKPEYVEGYFGNQSLSYTDTADFDFLKQLVAGTLDIQDIKLGISMENSIGADIRATIKSLKSVNTQTGNEVTLQHPIINMPLNIDRAVNFGYNSTPQYAPVVKSYPFTNATTNLAAFVSNLPNRVEYKVDLKVNPLGNISGGKDFLYRDAAIKINVDLDMPLTFKMGGLTLADTIDYDINAKEEDVDRYQGGNFKLFAANGFPLDARVQLYLVDENGMVTDSLFSTSLIAAAPVDANFKAIGQQQTLINFAVSTDKADKLVNTKKVVIKAVFDTKPQNQYLTMYSNYKLDLQLTSDFKFRMKL
ncbi:MAG: hypothetical protein M0D57_19365 [Sphingobacteriales bacterium JAD_PAG50586_3]|nr:MAG: hypothetical protein M0D57_19365 [Sphingobacteriales bacterium JAD_PAG50586_3]